MPVPRACEQALAMGLSERVCLQPDEWDLLALAASDGLGVGLSVSLVHLEHAQIMQQACEVGLELDRRHQTARDEL